MSRVSIGLVVAIVLGGAGARADTFAGWQYTAPAGYDVQLVGDRVALLRMPCNPATLL